MCPLSRSVTMKSADMNRRDFARLTTAAFGGVVAGTIAGCAGESATETPAEPAGGAAPAGGDTTTPEGGDAAAAEGSGTAAAEGEVTYDVAYMAEEPHVCRGLNTCMGKGASGDNACAGQGTCATAEAHSCHTHNACKGQGGCGEHAGINSCKGLGECGVPVENHVAWETARKNFEKAMQAAGKEFGPAPDAS